jgi:hypothetical protein
VYSRFARVQRQLTRRQAATKQHSTRVGVIWLPHNSFRSKQRRLSELHSNFFKLLLDYLQIPTRPNPSFQLQQFNEIRHAPMLLLDLQSLAIKRNALPLELGARDFQRQYLLLNSQTLFFEREFLGSPRRGVAVGFTGLASRLGNALIPVRFFVTESKISTHAPQRPFRNDLSQTRLGSLRLKNLPYPVRGLMKTRWHCVLVHPRTSAARP